MAYIEAGLPSLGVPIADDDIDMMSDAGHSHTDLDFDMLGSNTGEIDYMIEDAAVAEHGVNAHMGHQEQDAGTYKKQSDQVAEFEFGDDFATTDTLPHDDQQLTGDNGHIAEGDATISYDLDTADQYTSQADAELTIDQSL